MDHILNEFPTPDSPGNTRPSPIEEFYSGTTVFITGGTGFMGKILIEKLLRSCPDIKTVYLLVREKKGKSVHQRTVELLDDIVFAKLKAARPKAQHKVVAINGDCMVAGLGLSIEDTHTLKSEVDIVFHVAATVRFDEKLKLAVAINVNGTRDVLELCRHMPKLKSVIHVSTAYANCHLSKIEETLYQYPFDYEEFPHVLEKLDDGEIEQMTPKLLGKWPNTYAFTKAMAEALVRDKSKGLPLGVFRPAIVVSTYREPIKGWTDNLYGPTGVCAGALMGVLRTLHCDEDITANIIPVDLCVNALIASAWDVTTDRTTGELSPPKVYNYVSSVENPLTWGEYNKINMMFGARYPTSSAMWPLSFQTHRSGAVNTMYMIFLHMLPALVLDLVAITVGRKPRLLKMYKKVHKFSTVISHFCTNEWTFTNGNVQRMWGNLSESDRRTFDFDMRGMDWLSYFRDYILGIRSHLFKEEPESIPRAKLRQTRLSYAANILKIIFCYISVYTVWCAIKKVFQTTMLTLGF